MLFRVSLHPHAVGDVIHPGNFAEGYRNFRPGAPYPQEPWFTNLLIEVALESARKAARPDAPSRMTSFFSCENLDHARSFQRDCRSGEGEIYGIEPAEPNTALFRGNFTAISTPAGNTPYVDYLSDWARSYWTVEPTEIVEVLIGGPARVVTGPL